MLLFMVFAVQKVNKNTYIQKMQCTFTLITYSHSNKTGMGGGAAHMDILPSYCIVTHVQILIMKTLKYLQ